MLYLASRSARRRSLLDQLAYDYALVRITLLEQREPGEPVDSYVHRVARQKAAAGLAERMTVKDAVVLGADTEVIVDGEVLGKPDDADHARTMLRGLSGRSHEVITSVWCASADREAGAQKISRVSFAPLDTAALQSLIHAGDWQGKAGGYAIQGRAAGYISELVGSYSAVMGLPLFETAQLLTTFDIYPRGASSE